jgi:hypothetical protein
MLDAVLQFLWASDMNGQTYPTSRSRPSKRRVSST